MTNEQKLLAIVAHLSYLLGGVGFVLVPLIIWLLHKTDDFVSDHAKQALVAHLVLLAASAATGILCFILVGFILLPLIAIIWLIMLVASIMAAIRAFNGQYYNYPLIQYFVQKL